jgi:hypothetical protein
MQTWVTAVAFLSVIVSCAAVGVVAYELGRRKGREQELSAQLEILETFRKRLEGFNNTLDAEVARSRLRIMPSRPTDRVN